MHTVQVKIAELAVLKKEGVLVTYGLGSCVGIALYDPGQKVAGLAHILLDDSARYIKPGANSYNPAKFADTAIPLLLDSMTGQGARRAAVVARIAGGASLFNFQGTGGAIGAKNVESVLATLHELGIPLRGAEVGGSCGRTMRLLVQTGELLITTAGKGEIRL